MGSIQCSSQLEPRHQREAVNSYSQKRSGCSLQATSHSSRFQYGLLRLIRHSWNQVPDLDCRVSTDSLIRNHRKPGSQIFSPGTVSLRGGPPKSNAVFVLQPNATRECSG